ncbi:MAG: hypothetical protein RMY28_024260 [Nostoc sp. ChiSLP01]|nr:hypothetical protein [Nostoc sp. CmiSLP01]MDZ8283347.1 hypothetical protein [Nostoc sp. ChiSLP01]
MMPSKMCHGGGAKDNILSERSRSTLEPLRVITDYIYRANVELIIV